jgi:hypothetical protein
MDLQREAVHQPGEFDFLVVEAADELAELLLRSDDDPVLARPFTPRFCTTACSRASSGRRARRTDRLRR